jgi:hypothetical protein
MMNLNRKSFAFGFLSGILATLLVSAVLFGGLAARARQLALEERARAEHALRQAELKAQEAQQKQPGAEEAPQGKR